MPQPLGFGCRQGQSIPPLGGWRVLFRFANMSHVVATAIFMASIAKTVFVSLRVTPEFKSLLELAARQDQRTKTNLLEKLLLDYCREKGLLPVTPDRPST